EEDAGTPGERTAAAATALYHSKAAGGNRVSLFDGGPGGQRMAAYPVLVPLPLDVAPARAAEAGRRLRMLAVDDDDALLTLLRTTFEIIDLDVEEARSAEAAARRIEKAPPDVIVLDIRLPRSDELTFCR